MEELILYFSLKYDADYYKIYNALLQKEKVDNELKEKLFNRLKESGCKYTTIFSEDYPAKLKEINCPPFVLYYYGDLSLVQSNILGIIGTTTPSQYGIDATNGLTKELVDKNYTIINGMNIGVETAALETSFQNNGKNIVVLGSGIDYCYPLQNQELYNKLKSDHLVLSEIPFDMEPNNENVLSRKRLIAGLSDKILITELNIKSSTMLTVKFALEQNKDIYCVPSRIDDKEGCNMLIKQGAMLVLNADDIAENELDSIGDFEMA